MGSPSISNTGGEGVIDPGLLSPRDIKSKKSEVTTPLSGVPAGMNEIPDDIRGSVLEKLHTDYRTDMEAPVLPEETVQAAVKQALIEKGINPETVSKSAILELTETFMGEAFQKDAAAKAEVFKGIETSVNQFIEVAEEHGLDPVTIDLLKQISSALATLREFLNEIAAADSTNARELGQAKLKNELERLGFDKKTGKLIKQKEKKASGLSKLINRVLIPIAKMLAGATLAVFVPGAQALGAFLMADGAVQAATGKSIMQVATKIAEKVLINHLPKAWRGPALMAINAAFTIALVASGQVLLAATTSVSFFADSGTAEKTLRDTFGAKGDVLMALTMTANIAVMVASMIVSMGATSAAKGAQVTKEAAKQTLTAAKEGVKTAQAAVDSAEAGSQALKTAQEGLKAANAAKTAAQAQWERAVLDSLAGAAKGTSKLEKLQAAGGKIAKYSLVAQPLIGAATSGLQVTESLMRKDIAEMKAELDALIKAMRAMAKLFQQIIDALTSGSGEVGQWMNELNKMMAQTWKTLATSPNLTTAT